MLMHESNRTTNKIFPIFPRKYFCAKLDTTMNRLAQLMFGAIMIACFTGCAICCGPYLDHYPTFGGKVQRTDPTWGRVGSIYSDPYTAGTGPMADSNLTPFVRQPPKREKIEIEEKPKDIELPAEELNNGFQPGRQRQPQPDESLPAPKKDESTTQNRPANNRSGWRSGGGAVR